MPSMTALIVLTGRKCRPLSSITPRYLKRGAEWMATLLELIRMLPPKDTVS
jgi:hypothetical protein